MIFNVYKMYPEIVDDHVFMGKKRPELKLIIDTAQQSFMEYMQEHDNPPLTPDTYYIISEDKTEYYVLWNTEGIWCWDGALYIDRLAIATELDLTRDQARIWNEKDGEDCYCEYRETTPALTRLARVFPEYF